jgi:hypothetical protein
MPAMPLRSLASLLLTAASLAGCVSHAPEKYRLAPDSSSTMFALAPIGDDGTSNPLGLLDAERNGYPARPSQVAAYRDELVGPIAAFEALGGGQTLADRTDSAQP